MLTDNRNFDFYSVNAKGPETIARIAAENGVENFIHVSHLNAAPKSASKFYMAKYEGEQLVREAFPTATIVRPATLFGYEDRLLTNMASKSKCRYDIRGKGTNSDLVWPMWWNLNQGQTKIRPVHVGSSPSRK